MQVDILGETLLKSDLHLVISSTLTNLILSADLQDLQLHQCPCPECMPVMPHHDMDRQRTEQKYTKAADFLASVTVMLEVSTPSPTLIQAETIGPGWQPSASQQSVRGGTHLCS